MTDEDKQSSDVGPSTLREAGIFTRKADSARGIMPRLSPRGYSDERSRYIQALINPRGGETPYTVTISYFRKRNEGKEYNRFYKKHIAALLPLRVVIY